jgi:hypothetical protein
MLDYMAYLQTQARMRDQFTPDLPGRPVVADLAASRERTTVAWKHALAATLRVAADRLDAAPANLQPA